MARILIAEDNPDNFDMLKRRLERRGYSVDGAENGEIAVERVKASPPDLVLMDVSMPVMSGLDATRALREAGFTGLPIIALTAHAMDSDREACLAAGCDAYASKPVDFVALVGLIEARLSAAAA